MSRVFDVAARLVPIRLKRQAELERRGVVLFEKQADGIVRNPGELGAETVIVGGIGQRALTLFSQNGIRVPQRLLGALRRLLGQRKATPAFPGAQLTQPRAKS